MWNNMNECFKEFDLDKDGKINFQEFLNLCKNLFQNDDGVSYHIDEANFKEVFDIFDKNHNRVIDENEFEFMWDRWIKIILKPSAALVIVDVQNDFISGSLKFDNCKDLPKDGDVVTPINDLLVSIPFDAVAYSMDWHPENHISFIENVSLRKTDETSPIRSKDAKVFDTVIFHGPPLMEQKLWPKHAVQNTWGSQFHKDLKIVNDAIIVHKGTDPEIESYSAFWDNLKKYETDLRAELMKRNITDVFVCGLAYDYCVGGTSLDSLKAGFRTVVIDDCTAGITFEDMDKMKAALISKYGIIVNSDKVLAMVEGRDRRPELGYKIASELRTATF